MRILLILAGALLLPAALSGEAGGASSPKPELPEELQGKIDAAIRGSRAFLYAGLKTLLAQQGRVGAELTRGYEASWKQCRDLGGDGHDALLGLALVQSGVPASDPVLRKLWTRIEKRQPEFVYTVAVELLFMEGMLHPPQRGIAWEGASGKASPFPKDPQELDGILSWIRRRTEWLASGCQGGAWGYRCPGGGLPHGGADDTWRIRSPEGLLVPMNREALPALLKDPLDFGSPKWHDYSNTQYAALGLRAAALCGVAPKGGSALWRRMAQNLLLGQEWQGPAVMLEGGVRDAGWKGSRADYTVGPSGPGEAATPGFRLKAFARGWGYQMPRFRMDPKQAAKAETLSAQLRGDDLSGNKLQQVTDRLEELVTPCDDVILFSQPGIAARRSSYWTMTAAGLTVLVLAQASLGDLDAGEQEAVRKGIRDGLAWYQLNWERHRTSDAVSGAVDGYAFYGLERVGILANLSTLGGKNWYREGAERLVAIQKPDGSWPRGYATHRSDEDGAVLQAGWRVHPPEINTAFCLLFLSCGTSKRYAYDVGEASPAP